jgi:hypothetical protein
MLKIGAFLTLNGKMQKNSENQKKNATFVPVNRSINL